MSQEVENMQHKQVSATMGMREWAMLILLSVLWGGSFFSTAIAVTELPTFVIVNLRVGLAAVMLWIMLYAVGQKMLFTKRAWIAFLGMGLLNNVIPFSLIVWGQSHIASGLASILNAATPIFTVLVAHIFTHDEKMTPAKLFGVAIGFSGVAMMIGLEALNYLGAEVWAQLACIGATLGYAFSGAWGRRFKRMNISPMATATGQLTCSTILLLPVTLMVDKPWTLSMPSIDVVAAILFLAIVATALAYLLFFKILSVAGATNVMLVTLLVPVSTIMLGAAFLGEVLEAKHFIGMALIALGLGAIDGRLLRLIFVKSKQEISTQ